MTQIKLAFKKTPAIQEISTIIWENKDKSTEWFKEKIQTLLTESNLDINQKYTLDDTCYIGDWTLLGSTAKSGNVAAAKALFQLGAKSSVVAGYRQAWGDFQWAIYYRDFAMLDVFIENGADMTDIEGLTLNIGPYNWDPLKTASYEGVFDKAILHGVAPLPPMGSEFWACHMNQLFNKIQNGSIELEGSVLHRDFVALAKKVGIDLDLTGVTLIGEQHGQNVIEYFHENFEHNKLGNLSTKKPGTYCLSYEAYKDALAKDEQEESEHTKRLEETEKYSQIAYKDAMKASEFREKQEEERASAEIEATKAMASDLASSIIDNALADIQAPHADANINADLGAHEASMQVEEIEATGASDFWPCSIL